MPKTIFEAAICSQCGAQLDVVALRCSQCGANFTINWQEAKLALTTVGTKLEHRDPVVDALLVAAWQRKSLSVGLPMIVAYGTQFEHSEISIVSIYFSTVGNQEPHLVAGIQGFVGGYRLQTFFPPDGYDFDDLSWDEVGGAEERLYTIGHRYPDYHRYLGEDSLFRGEYLKALVNRSVNCLLPPPPPRPVVSVPKPITFWEHCRLAFNRSLEIRTES